MVRKAPHRTFQTPSETIVSEPIEPPAAAMPPQCDELDAAASAEPAPDLVEPVVAYHSWRVVDGELVSPFVRERWDGGVATARCVRGGARARGEILSVEHASPHPDCRCGIHAYFEPRSAVSDVDFRRVLGVVAVWGRMEMHPEGVRAEFAQIQALGDSPGWSSWHRADVAAIAERLEIPLVDEESLAAIARETGGRPVVPAPREPRRADSPEPRWSPGRRF
jgi:hypothetical protein